MALKKARDTFGITDHNYGVGYGRHSVFCATANMELDNYERTLRRYYDHINLIREAYAGRINVLRGIEICTLKSDQHPNFSLPDGADISFFDYCLIENLDASTSVTGGDLFAYAKRLGTPVVGIAHTDLFGHIERLGADPLDYFKRMADENIFWEMNVNYDSIHRFQEHEYTLNFLGSRETQKIVRDSGIKLTVGFDGHRVYDYAPERVRTMNEFIFKNGFNIQEF